MSAAERLPALDARHAVTPALAERLLSVLREGLPTCPELPPGAAASTWWPGATARSCLACAQVRLRFVAFDVEQGEAVLCDGCGITDLTHQPGQPYLLPVGCVLVVVMLCEPCGTRRLRGEYDLDEAAREVDSLIGVRRREGY